MPSWGSSFQEGSGPPWFMPKCEALYSLPEGWAPEESLHHRNIEKMRNNNVPLIPLGVCCLYGHIGGHYLGLSLYFCIFLSLSLSQTFSLLSTLSRINKWPIAGSELLW